MKLKIFIIFISVFTILFEFNSTTAFAGGESSGGANGIICDEYSKPVLLDYLSLNNKYFDIYKDSDATRGDVLVESNFAKTIGYDRIPIEQFSNSIAFKLAINRLEIWKKQGLGSPVVTSLILQAMLGMDWLYTSFR